MFVIFVVLIQTIETCYIRYMTSKIVSLICSKNLLPHMIPKVVKNLLSENEETTLHKRLTPPMLNYHILQSYAIALAGPKD